MEKQTLTGKNHPTGNAESAETSKSVYEPPLRCFQNRIGGFNVYYESPKHLDPTKKKKSTQVITKINIYTLQEILNLKNSQKYIHGSFTNSATMAPTLSNYQKRKKIKYIKNHYSITLVDNISIVGCTINQNNS